MGQSFNFPPIAPGASPPTAGNQVLVTNLQGSQNVPVSATSYNINGAVSRPNNTTTYTANSIVNSSTSAGTYLTFLNCARINGGSGIITAAILQDYANQTLLGTFNLYVFNQPPASYNDASSVAFTSSDLTKLVGVIPFNSGILSGTAINVYNAVPVNTTFVNANSTKNLYGYIVVTNAYVPIANESFIVQLCILAD